MNIILKLLSVVSLVGFIVLAAGLGSLFPDTAWGFIGALFTGVACGVTGGTLAGLLWAESEEF